MNRQDLVVLEYASNTCYTNLLSLEEFEKRNTEESNQKLSVNLKKGTWSFQDKDRKIGETRDCEYGARGGVIGVFNKNDINQLNALVNSSQSATRSPSVVEEY